MLNRPQRVGKDIVSKVRAAATALGYVPHRGAQSLVSRKFGVIGAIVPTLENPVFAKATQALQGKLSEHGVGLLLASTECDPELEYAQLRSLIAHGIDGVVLEVAPLV